ncbi:sensor histidine kinase [Schauerella aestuarii]|uniref:sensor histidine kinase n=1 Tax=Schauerella aestuarii TaxID=2511204 RepID=UPI0013700BBC|nr:HAMP domain-containing sensor histidine kinase [Achromobacter aestuarii]
MNRMPRNSLTVRLLAATALALLMTTTVVGALSYVVVTHYPGVWLEADFVSTAEEVADGLIFDAADRPIALKIHPGLTSAYEALHNDMLYRVVDPDGNVLLAADANAKPLAPHGEAFDPALTRFDLMRDGNLLHVATFPLDRPGPIYFLQLARSERFQQAMTGLESSTAHEAGLTATLAALLIFSAIVFYTIRRVLKPLHTASEAAAHITPGNRHTRLSTEGMPSELVPLITALNQALERLSVGYAVQQEFLATAAHELKTPLALMRGTVELGNSPDRTTLLADIDGMSRQVQQLLQLAECSESQNYTMGQTDMVGVVADATAKLSRLATNAHVVMHTTLAPCVISADRAALFILLRNLLENAVRFAPRGSAIDIVLNAQGLSVRDYGVGISAQDIAMVFKRYWRGSESGNGEFGTGGSGLGLAICLQIAQAHGWTISVHDAEPGARFQVDFLQPRGA